LMGEIFGGVACCYVLKYLYEQATSKSSSWTDLLKARLVLAFAFCLIAGQSLGGLWLAMVHFECANENLPCDHVMQPLYTNRFSTATFKRLGNMHTVNQVDFSRNYSFSQEASYLFRDREALGFYSESDKEQFRDVQLWINCIDGTSAYMSMAAENVPIISVAKFLNLFDYMEAPGARQKVRELLRANQSKKMYTVVQPDACDRAFANLARVNLKPGAPRVLSLPTYSPNIRTRLLLFELTYSDDE